jgi:hypothetical protein
VARQNVQQEKGWQQGCQVAAGAALKCGSLKTILWLWKIRGCKVAVNVPEVLKCGRTEVVLKCPNETESDRRTATSIKYACL